MAINLLHTAFVDQTATTIALSQMVSVSTSGTNPAYLVLTAIDRNDYTAGSTGATGSFTGNGHALAFSAIGSDGRGAGLVFTYQASTGRYYNSTYGYLDQLVYTSSGNANDVTNISLYGTNNLSLATQYAGNAWYMMQLGGVDYLGSVTVATQPSYTGTVPEQATPASVIAAADSFVGKVWNMNGCWVLASTIAAEAGASLPVRSTAVGLAGQADGEWIVAYNGPAGQTGAGQTGAWQTMLTAGEIIVMGFSNGGGHIATCVSGSGGTAMLVDNATFVTSGGTVLNAANDGSSSDIVIAAPHLASQEFGAVLANTVVIYQLDTPVVSTTVGSLTISTGTTRTLASLFTVIDPANRAIAAWQVYDTALTDALVHDGTTASSHTAATALAVSSLSSVSLLAGGTATGDTLMVRAYNGSYWGDWQSLVVTVAAGTAAQTPGQASRAPVVTTQTAAQSWLAGQAISLALPADTFTDPNGQSLTYAATLASGAALPSWLKFNAATNTFTGTAPAGAQTLSIAVKATDTAGLSVSETFGVTVIGAPAVTVWTPSQSWVMGQAIALTLPANTFTDPQGQALTWSAKLASGAALPSWLHFDAATHSFSGTAPSIAQSAYVQVTATDTSGLSTSETFAVTVRPGIAVTNQTPAQAWLDNTALNVVLPGNTFTDSLGLKMSFAAYQTAGPNVTSWLRFNASTLGFSGAVPANQSGTIGIAILAADAAQSLAIDTFSVSFAATASGVRADLQQVGTLSYDPYKTPEEQGLIPLKL